jgi:hypothetical protein
MTVYPYDVANPIRLPTAAEVRAHMNDPRTARTVVISAAVMFLGVLALAALMVVRGQGVQAMLMLVGVPLVAGVGLILRRLGVIHDEVRTVAQAVPDRPADA